MLNNVYVAPYNIYVFKNQCAAQLLISRHCQKHRGIPLLYKRFIKCSGSLYVHCITHMGSTIVYVYICSER